MSNVTAGSEKLKKLIKLFIFRRKHIQVISEGRWVGYWCDGSVTSGEGFDTSSSESDSKPTCAQQTCHSARPATCQSHALLRDVNDPHYVAPWWLCVYVCMCRTCVCSLKAGCPSDEAELLVTSLGISPPWLWRLEMWLQSLEGKT